LSAGKGPPHSGSISTWRGEVELAGAKGQGNRVKEKKARAKPWWGAGQRPARAEAMIVFLYPIALGEGCRILRSNAFVPIKHPI